MYTLRHPVARALAVGVGFGVMFAAVDDVALIFLACDELRAGALRYGVLASAYGIGLALGSLALMRGRAGRAEASFVFGLFLTGMGGLLTGLAPVFWVAALTQAVGGTGNGLDVVATDTLVQRSVPRSHRGRVFGVVSGATLIGAAVARGFGGVLLDLTSSRATFVIGGSCVLLVTALSLALFRAVATMGKRRGETREVIGHLSPRICLDSGWTLSLEGDLYGFIKPGQAPPFVQVLWPYLSSLLGLTFLDKHWGRGSVPTLGTWPHSREHLL